MLKGCKKEGKEGGREGEKRKGREGKDGKEKATRRANQMFNSERM
jgi:hypothetical protein